MVLMDSGREAANLGNLAKDSRIPGQDSPAFVFFIVLVLLFAVT